MVVFTGTPGKTADALRLGAREVVLSGDAQEMLRRAGSFDFILDTIAAEVTGIEQIDDPCERMLRSDVRYRLVMDTASLR